MSQVVGLTGWTHLASVKGGLTRPIPLGQGRRVKIVSRVRLPMQVDGEAYLQRKGVVLEVTCPEQVQVIVPHPLAA